jgi:hypothetical protein
MPKEGEEDSDVKKKDFQKKKNFFLGPFVSAKMTILTRLEIIRSYCFMMKKTEMKLAKLFGVVIYCPNLLSYAQCYTTFDGPNLRMFII